MSEVYINGKVKLISSEAIDKEIDRWYNICRMLIIGRIRDFGFMDTGDIWGDMYYMIEMLIDKHYYGAHPISDSETLDMLIRLARAMKKYDKKLGNPVSVINRAKKLNKAEAARKHKEPVTA
ncbi:MAG: hypothetical protein LUD47_07800 [Clostridia bacterium]|nr:hypothetical protein [Clostridia bacterium]